MLRHRPFLYLINLGNRIVNIVSLLRSARCGNMASTTQLKMINYLANQPANQIDLIKMKCGERLTCPSGMREACSGIPFHLSRKMCPQINTPLHSIGQVPISQQTAPTGLSYDGPTPQHHNIRTSISSTLYLLLIFGMHNKTTDVNLNRREVKRVWSARIIKMCSLQFHVPR